MKKLLLFILLFFINSPFGNSCGYYPYGEDVRFSFLKPNLLFPNSKSYFFYNAQEYSYPTKVIGDFSSGKYDENIELWRNLLLLKQGDRRDIYEAIYIASANELTGKSSGNEATRKLNSFGNEEIKQYLLFAKTLSYLNGNTDDAWERKEKDLTGKRNKMIAKCIMNSHKTKSKELKRRYAHLAIRLAYYNKDKDKLNQLYRSYFDRTKLNDALDFWALHFKLQFDTPSPQRNIDAALVFANSAEKQFQVSKKIEGQFSLDECLVLAKSEQERSALFYAYAVKSAKRSLSEMNLFAERNSDEHKLLFLTLREINKLEDWILTPYYSAFEPTTRTTWSDSITGKILMKRIVRDRQYAAQLSEWLVDLRKKNPSFKSEWWSALKLYTDFLAADHDDLSTKLLLETLSKTKNPELLQFLDKIYVLEKIVTSSNGSLVDLELDALVYSYKNDNKFLFAVGRELEFKGNKTEAATILSKVNIGEDFSESMVWKTQSRHRSLGMDFYYEYFFYMDAAYEVEEVEALIEYINADEKSNKFDVWKNANVKKDLNRLYHLLGTKQLRKDNLAASLRAFNKVAPDYWEQEKFTMYLNKDPFDNNFISNDFDASEKKYTKPEIVEKLMKLKAQVAVQTGDKKALSAFRVANCYRNMSYHGNAWLMRRFWRSGSHSDAGLEDDKEYIQANLAKKYYLLAKQSAETKKFAALSLRLAGTCEKYKLYDEIEDQWDFDNFSQYVFDQNGIYTQLKREYPEQYEPLISNCATLYTYFDAVGN